MQVTVSSQHIRLTNDLKRFAMEHLYEPLRRIWRKEGALLEIHLRDLHGPKRGIDQECRAVLYIPGGGKLVITEITDDIRKSVHQASKRLMRRARQYIGHKVQAPRHPHKYYLARLAEDRLFTGDYPTSEQTPSAQETMP
jgi:ribosome-associated translation inhibitor RaiA